MKQFLVGFILLLSVSGCAGWPRAWSEYPCCLDSKPTLKKQSIAWHLADVTVFSQVEQAFHIVRVARKWFGVPVRSLNLNDGSIASSAFFTNRDLSHLKPEDVRWGPSRPDERPSPPFVITKLKGEGKTPGFFVEDSRRVGYLLKLDPVRSPELLSGAEVVSSKLLHALGYYVPSYEIVEFKPSDLRIGPNVIKLGPKGVEEQYTTEDLRDIIEVRLRDGKLRAVASKILEGEILGPASFKRFKDCTDVRALRLVYAWLNNIDAKDHNTLLVWDGTRTVGHLIDFGTSLGADAGRGRSKSPCAGWTNIVDIKVFSLELLTLGWYRSGCNKMEESFSPAVGLISKYFSPRRWKPYAPNLAFEEMNEDDARWIAQRMRYLSRDHIAAAVEAGRYSNPTDSAYLVSVLNSRRLEIIKEYLDEESEELSGE